MRIISWNIQWGRGADGRVDLDRIAGVLHDIGDADVICLQEVAQCFPGLAGGRSEDAVAILASAFPDYEPVFGAALDVPDGKGGRARFGNLTLSRLSVGQVFRHVLPSPPDEARPSMQRMCVEAVIDTPAGGLRVMNTHLEYYSLIQRTAQIQCLREIHAESARRAHKPSVGKDTNPGFSPWPRPVSAVLCGDFNCEASAAEYRLLQHDIAPDVPALRDAWAILHPEKLHPHSVGLHGADWPDHAFCCDFAFVSADLTSQLTGLTVISDTDASDHQPLVLDLAF